MFLDSDLLTGIGVDERFEGDSDFFLEEDFDLYANLFLDGDLVFEGDCGLRFEEDPSLSFNEDFNRDCDLYFDVGQPRNLLSEGGLDLLFDVDNDRSFESKHKLLVESDMHLEGECDLIFDLFIEVESDV